MPSVANHLIEGLPRQERGRLLSICEPVELVRAEVLCDSNVVARHIYFPTGSTFSLFTPREESPVFGIGMVGSEGMLGTHIALGIPTAGLHAHVQGAGSALRIATASFQAELTRNVALRRRLNRYVHVNLLQFLSAARCSRFHRIDSRLARWLLMTQDRAHEDCFSVTHETMARALGVRRVGITTAAVALQRQGVIRYARGVITILDRSALERAACACYVADCESYDRFLS